MIIISYQKRKKKIRKRNKMNMSYVINKRFDTTCCQNIEVLCCSSLVRFRVYSMNFISYYLIVSQIPNHCLWFNITFKRFANILIVVCVTPCFKLPFVFAINSIFILKHFGVFVVFGKWIQYILALQPAIDHVTVVLLSHLFHTNLNKNEKELNT